MKKEIPQPVIYGLGGILLVGAVIAAAMFFGGGPGRMSSDDIKRAELQAEAGNQRMNQYIGNTKGGPPTGGEAAAREKHRSGQ